MAEHPGSGGRAQTYFLLLVSSALACSWTAALAAQAGRESTAPPQSNHAAATVSIDSVGSDHASPALRAPHVIRWYEGAAAVAGASALMLLDDPVEQTVQNHRSTTSNHLATAFRQVGQPDVFLTVSAGMIGTGVLAHDPFLTRAGERLFTSLGLAGTSALLLKKVIGRARPVADSGAFHFAPFSHDDALPSGHTTMAFALATSLADDIHSPWAGAGLYAIAAGTAWSRLNDNKHWLSDTGLGAIIGMTAAKLIDGRWQLFGLKPPSILVAPSGSATMSWHFTF